MLNSSPSGNSFLHPIHWLKNRCSEADARQQKFSMPYSVHLPILPSNLHAKWRELSERQPDVKMENSIFHYAGNGGAFFSALLEVNRWQGVFCLSPHQNEGNRKTLTKMEFWGMALREHSNLDTFVPDVEKAQGVVFWQNGTLNVYPADLGPCFERFFNDYLLS